MVYSMAGSIYGRLFQISTWGESHGKGIGVVIDGCPAGFLFQRRISRFIWIEENPDKASLQPDVRKVYGTDLVRRI